MWIEKATIKIGLCQLVLKTKSYIKSDQGILQDMLVV